MKFVSVAAICALCAVQMSGHAVAKASSAVASEYNVPPDPIPAELFAGDVLNYDPQATLFDNLPPPPAGATVNLLSGTIDFLGPVGGTVNLAGGNLATFTFADGANINVGSGSDGAGLSIEETTLNIDGGTVVELYATDSIVNFSSGTITLFEQFNGSQLNMTGGTVELQLFGSLLDGRLNVSGGVLGDLRLGTGTTLAMSGGQVGFGPGQSYFVAEPGSSVHLIVSQLEIDGQPVGGLSAGSTTPLDVAGLDAQLTGVFRDGSQFLFQLGGSSYDDFTSPNEPLIYTQDFFGVPSGPVQVFVTLVPEPSTLGLAALAAIAANGAYRRRN